MMRFFWNYRSLPKEVTQNTTMNIPEIKTKLHFIIVNAEAVATILAFKSGKFIT